jgi:hydroxymethylbilane synthase
MPPKSIRIGTRGSKLALWQARHVESLIQEKFPNLNITLVPITTTGDKVLDVSLSEIGNKSLFLKEIEDELLAGRIDLAVHSMKDVPAEMLQGLVIASVLKRENPLDAFISKKYKSFETMPAGSRVATSSLRRVAQLKSRRSDLLYQPMRGNVDTRLRKLEEGECDAIILAAAGLIRLGLKNSITQYLDILPAVAQGAIGLEIREGDNEIAKIAEALNDPDTFLCVSAERAFLKQVGGDCRVPVGCFVQKHNDKLTISALLSDCAGLHSITRDCVSTIASVQQDAIELATDILKNGGKEIMESLGRN